MGGPLTPAERGALLVLARASIEEALRSDGSLERALASVGLTPSLMDPGASFVTVKAPGPAPQGGWTLRGCVGGIVARDPLYRSVIHNASEAAFRDPRFPPVALDELRFLVLSVSVLTPPRPVAGPEEIVPGKDGVILEKGWHQAVFLPQVAVEQGWETWQLLEHLALKAGLARDGWQDGRLWTFETETFGEESPTPSS